MNEAFSPRSACVGTGGFGRPFERSSKRSCRDRHTCPLPLTLRIEAPPPAQAQPCKSGASVAYALLPKPRATLRGKSNGPRKPNFLLISPGCPELG